MKQVSFFFFARAHASLTLPAPGDVLLFRSETELDRTSLITKCTVHRLLLLSFKPHNSNKSS